MKLLVDAHTFIWAWDHPSKLGPRAVAALQDPANELLLSAGTIWEIAIKVGLDKLSLSMPYRQWMNQAMADLGRSLSRGLSSRSAPKAVVSVTSVLYNGFTYEGVSRMVGGGRITPVVEKAAQALVDMGAREVYLFGSAATGEWREGSDVDLAVSGLPARNFFPAVGLALEILKGDVDLVDLDEDTPFTRYLKATGELVRVR